MADGFQADGEQLRRHAAALEAVRGRFAGLQGASSHIGQNDAAYGKLCGWMSGILEGRHRQHDQLLAYVSENLALAADALSGVADDYARVDDSAAQGIRRAGETLR